MSQQMVKQVDRVIRAALIVLVIGFLTGQVTAAPSAAAQTMRPTMVSQVFDVNCTSLPAVTPTYAKLLDMATFTVQSPDSTVNLTFNGRIFVGSFASGTGAIFELRVDDAVSPLGRARANLRAAEAGGGGVHVTITGSFTGLSAGEHTASMWVRTSNGGAATQALVDPGCWSSDVLIVQEYLPFGFTFLPSVATP